VKPDIPGNEKILQMITGFWASKILTVATELGLFDLLSKKGLEIHDIAEGLSIQRRPANIISNACVALGLLKKERRYYFNTDIAGIYLVKGKRGYLGRFVCMLGNSHYLRWGGGVKMLF